MSEQDHQEVASEALLEDVLVAEVAMHRPARRWSIAAGLMLMGSTLLAPHAAASDGTFIDDDDNVHEPNIEATYQTGISTACAPERFCPDEPITRETMANWLNNDLNLPVPAEDYFTDDNNSPHEDDINALAAVGIINGVGEGSFMPGSPLSRAQMAKFMANGYRLGPTDRDYFPDDNGIVLEDYVNRLARAGITIGNNGLFYPEGQITRGQMASFMARAAGLEPVAPLPGPAVDPRDIELIWVEDPEWHFVDSGCEFVTPMPPGGEWRVRGAASFAPNLGSFGQGQDVYVSVEDQEGYVHISFKWDAQYGSQNPDVMRSNSAYCGEPPSGERVVSEICAAVGLNQPICRPAEGEEVRVLKAA